MCVDACYVVVVVMNSELLGTRTVFGSFPVYVQAKLKTIRQ